MLCIKVCSLFHYSLSKYFREYASLLSHDFRNFTSLGEKKIVKKGIGASKIMTILVRLVIKLN
jgi:hypothetical protein